MPRPPRLHVPGGCYHVTLRGNHCEPLFASSEERVRLDTIVAQGLERFGARLHAYCWMTNHLHALIQVGDEPLGVLVQSVASRYSRYRHEALETSGHLFERRYHARLIDVSAYLAAVLRYVHLNPVKAGLVVDPADYPWSSHRAYLGRERIPWLTVDLGLSLFGADRASARREYARFVNRRDIEDDDIESLEHANDRRVLGDDTFVAGLPPVVERAAPSETTLDALAERVCREHDVSPELLRSKSAERRLTPVRLELLERALEQRVANVAEVARYLNRDPSTLSRLRARWRRSRNARPAPIRRHR